MEVVTAEAKRLRRDPVLRRLADRMARNVDPVQVRKLYDAFDVPTDWFARRMDWYWRHHKGFSQTDEELLVDRTAPARAVVAVYRQKRKLIEDSLGGGGGRA